MDSINWLGIHLTPEELSKLNEDIHEPMPVQSFLVKIVHLILEDYPWNGRTDTITSFHPTEFYENEQWISLPIHDREKILPPVFQIAQVLKAEQTENPIQGKFQVLTLDVNGIQAKLACGILNAPFPETKLDELSSEQQIWLIKWITNTYSENLLSACTNYMLKGELWGRFQDGFYTPKIIQPSDTTNQAVTEEIVPSSSTSQPIYKKLLGKILLFIKRHFRRER